MKTMKYFMMALVCLLMQSATCLADGRPIPVEQLPKAAKDFVAKYFPGQNIIYAEKEYGKYEARFNNGMEIEFDKKGNWDKVDCKTTAVPAALIPEAIAQYV
ncbi:MAG: PepSY-like domain-containing protein, partial [Prevotella sp.]|nr:PepSY-like domain-containing protein [Prevotella sp.]